jgi:hypothetical protein
MLFVTLALLTVVSFAFVEHLIQHIVQVIDRVDDLPHVCPLPVKDLGGRIQRFVLRCNTPAVSV